jgi:alpha-tubulin suppressor-like RCC1 family protein
LAEVTRVSTPTNDNETSYTFSSNEEGTIAYAGGCTSSTTAATVGNNNINFNALPEDTYSTCTITVTDNLSHASIALPVSTFIIDTTAPTLSVVTAVTTPTNDTTPSYVFRSNEAGTKSYGGSCGSSSTSATTSGDNTIALKQPDNSTVLSDNTSYSTCTITVTDLAGNPSTALTVNTFVVDTTAPTVSSTSPTDNESSISISNNISVTFSESMGTASVTTNTSNTICSGSLQLSSDSFSSCVQMASSPSSSDNRTFTVTSSPKMFYSTTYKIRVTTAAEDSAGNNIAQSTQTYGFKTSVTFPMTAGSAHSCFMLDNGSVKCWGKNNLGQLGLGNTSNRGDNSSEMGDNLPVVDLGTGRTAKAIAAGSDHTCAILDNASIKCWGANASGQLGIANTNNRGDESSEMGDILPAIDLGSGRTATAIAAGGNHTCAILDNESIKCWGKNASGQLGIGDTNNRGDGSNPMGDDLPVVDLGSERTAKVIVAGGSHTCTILDDSSIKCWGENDQGQLGLGNTTDSLNASVVDMGSGITAKALAAGESHTCAILNNSAIKCWGRANEGQMGLFKWNINIGSGSNQMGTTGQDDLTKIGTGRTAVAIAAGKNHNCAILDNSSIKCWGANTSGQLGIGDTVNRGATQDGSDQMGDNLPVVDLGSGRTARGIIAGDNQT